MTDAIEIVRLQGAIEATNKEVARTQSEIEALKMDRATNKEVARTQKEIAHLKTEVDKLRQWRSWTLGATATIGILLGLFASKIKAAFGIQ